MMINDCESGFDYFKSILYDSPFMMQDTLIQKHKQEAQYEEKNIILYDLISQS